MLGTDTGESHEGAEGRSEGILVRVGRRQPQEAGSLPAPQIWLVGAECLVSSGGCREPHEESEGDPEGEPATFPAHGVGRDGAHPRVSTLPHSLIRNI